MVGHGIINFFQLKPHFLSFCLKKKNLKTVVLPVIRGLFNGFPRRMKNFFFHSRFFHIKTVKKTLKAQVTWGHLIIKQGKIGRSQSIRFYSRRKSLETKHSELKKEEVF